jgi:hypothetical protein
MWLLTSYEGVMPTQSLKYLEQIEEKYKRASPRFIADRILQITQEHDD